MLLFGPRSVTRSPLWSSKPSAESWAAYESALALVATNPEVVYQELSAQMDLIPFAPAAAKLLAEISRQMLESKTTEPKRKLFVDDSVDKLFNKAIQEQWLFERWNQSNIEEFLGIDFVEANLEAVQDGVRYGNLPYNNDARLGFFHAKTNFDVFEKVLFDRVWPNHRINSDPLLMNATKSILFALGIVEEYPGFLMQAARDKPVHYTKDGKITLCNNQITTRFMGANGWLKAQTGMFSKQGCKKCVKQVPEEVAKDAASFNVWSWQTFCAGNAKNFIKYSLELVPDDQYEAGEFLKANPKFLDAAKTSYENWWITCMAHSLSLMTDQQIQTAKQKMSEFADFRQLDQDQWAKVLGQVKANRDSYQVRYQLGAALKKMNI